MSEVTGFLDKKALRHLTGKAQVNTQEEWLRNRGVPYKREGLRILVMWTHVQAWIEGKTPQAQWEPDFSYIEEADRAYAAKQAMWAEKRAQKAALATRATSPRKDSSK